MRGSTEKQSELTFFSNVCEVAKGQFLPDILPEEANGVTETCENEFRENIITCKTPDKELFVQEVEGLSLDSVSLNGTVQGLPVYVPVLDKRVCKEDILTGDECEYVGVSLTDILKSGIKEKAGGFVETEIVFNTELLKQKAFVGKKVILLMTGCDTLIEWVWFNRNNKFLYQTLHAMGFYAVSGFNFSVMIGECAFAQTLNIKRSLYSAALAERFGLKAIPHVYAVTDNHVTRWITWFKQNPAMQLFTVNCQFQKSDEMIDLTVEMVSDILNAIPGLHVILQGFRIKHLGKLAAFEGRIHLADTVPSKYSQSKRKVNARGLKKSERFDLVKEPKILFEENLKTRTQAIKQTLTRKEKRA